MKRPRTRSSLFAAFAGLAMTAPSGCTHDEIRTDRWHSALGAELPLPCELDLGHSMSLGGNGVSASHQRRVRVVTYNVHFGKDVSSLATAIARSASLSQADVLLLQEMQSHPDEGTSRSRRLAALLKMNYVYAPAVTLRDSGTHGLAVLSRYPIVTARIMTLPQYKLAFRSERRIALWTTLDIDGAALEVINVHLDTRINPWERLQQLRPALDLGPKQVLIGGDFNTNDLHWVFGSLPLAHSGQCGAVDSFMKAYGFDTPTSGSGPTDNMPVVRLRLDSIFTRALSACGGGVERSVKVSDHLPVWVDVAWPPNRTTAC